MTWRLDHLVVSAVTLDAGAKWVEDALGAPLQIGGRHALMGTHNLLLGLGEYYLEVIAIDPNAPAPDYPRWFDLDNFTDPPQLTHWAVSCDNLTAEVAKFPADCGVITDFERGELRWQVALSSSGKNPMDDAAPLMIEWQGKTRVPSRLTEQNVRLNSLTIAAPQGVKLGAALGELSLCNLIDAKTKSLSASFATPQGVRQLS